MSELYPTPKEGWFNDFYLFTLGHLLPVDESPGMGPPYSRLRREINKRISLGKQAILKHTKPGDAVALETPEPVTLEDLKKQFALLSPEKRVDEEMGKHRWEEVNERHMNRYAELAEFARTKGRRVVSLEPSSAKSDGKMRQYNTLLSYEPEKLSEKDRQRVNYLLIEGRNRFYMNRIHKTRPKLVIAAGAHGVTIEDEMKPARGVAMYPKLKEPFNRLRLRMYSIYRHLRHLENRAQRRKKVAEEKGLKFRRPK